MFQRGDAASTRYMLAADIILLLLVLVSYFLSPATIKEWRPWYWKTKGATAEGQLTQDSNSDESRPS